MLLIDTHFILFCITMSMCLSLEALLTWVSSARSDKEVKRGDHAVWDVDKHGNIGQRERGGGFSAKYCYDTVFGPELGNKSVYESIAQPMIMPALEV